MVKRYETAVYEAQVEYLDNHGPPRVQDEWWMDRDPHDPLWRDAVLELAEQLGEKVCLSKVYWDSFRRCYVWGPPEGPPSIRLDCW